MSLKNYIKKDDIFFLISIKAEMFWDRLVKVFYQGTQFTDMELKASIYEPTDVMGFSGIMDFSAITTSLCKQKKSCNFQIRNAK